MKQIVYCLTTIVLLACVTSCSRRVEQAEAKPRQQLKLSASAFPVSPLVIDSKAAVDAGIDSSVADVHVDIGRMELTLEIAELIGCVILFAVAGGLAVRQYRKWQRRKDSLASRRHWEFEAWALSAHLFLLLAALMQVAVRILG